MYDFKPSFINKYLQWTFQHPQPNDYFPQSRRGRFLCYLCQLLALCIGWSYFIYESHNNYVYCSYYFSDKRILPALITMLVHQIIMLFRMTGLQSIGFYFFHRNDCIIKKHVDDINILIMNQDDNFKKNVFQRYQESREENIRHHGTDCCCHASYSDY